MEANRSSFKTVDAGRALEVIAAMMVAYGREHRIEATTLLIDPSLWRTLVVAAREWSDPVNPLMKTVFGLAVIEVYKPYPFLAICHLMIEEE